MNNLAMRTGLKTAGRWINHNSPKILTLLGITSGISAAIMAVKVTPKYQYELAKLHEDELEKLTSERMQKRQLYLEELKIFAKNYGPAVGVGVISCASVLSAQHINNKRIAGLATAYKLSESALKEYQAKVIEKVGEKKAEAIKKELLEDKLAKEHPREEDLVDLPREPGDYLCYDCFLDKYFYSTETKIQKAFNIINRRLNREMWVSLNDLYFELGYAKNSSVGRMLGWSVEHTGEGGVEPDIRAIPSDFGPPILTVEYDADLRQDYY